MATPAFRCIRENFPKAKITLAIKNYVYGLVETAPWFDEFILIDQGVVSVLQHLRRERYDLGFLFPNSFRSALLFFLGGVKHRIGYKRDARSWLLTNGLDRLKEDGRFLPTYMGEYYLRLCEETGCSINSRELELFITEEDQKRAAEILKKCNIYDEQPLILFNPGASYGTSKCWTSEGFARTADIIHEALNCNIAAIGAPHEELLACDIVNKANTEVINLANQDITLGILKAIIKRCNLLITVDSGPRHIAVALKRPVITLMGPNDPRYTESPAETGQVIRADVDCLACQLKVCPKDHRCMKQIKPDVVAKAGLDFIS